MEYFDGAIECYSAGEGKGSAFMFSMNLKEKIEDYNLSSESNDADEAVSRLDPIPEFKQMPKSESNAKLISDSRN